MGARYKRKTFKNLLGVMKRWRRWEARSVKMEDGGRGKKGERTKTEGDSEIKSKDEGGRERTKCEHETQEGQREKNAGHGLSTAFL